MKVLLVTANAPLAPLEGTGLVVAALREQLGDRHDLRILALARPEDRSDDPAIRLVRPPATSRARDAALLARWALGGAPLRAATATGALAPALSEELASFAPDVVHVTPGDLCSLQAQLGGRPAIAAPLDAWHVAAETRAFGAGRAQAALLRMEARRRRAHELRNYPHYSAVVVVSDLDARALTDPAHPLPLHVIPNGVDAARFARRPGSVPRIPAEMVFHGSMAHPPNEVAAEHLARELLPLVRARVPEATLRLVGREPTPRVLALGALDGVTVTGAVDDVRDALDRAGVYACPMLTGSGIKNKVLEAMANGLPVVGTPLAYGGLDVRDGAEGRIAETPAALAGAIAELMLDPGGEAARLGAAGEAYVTEHRSWEATARAYEALYEQALARGRS
jgi:glycosyltransferase involved in cell wall biosynthesis